MGDVVLSPKLASSAAGAGFLLNGDRSSADPVADGWLRVYAHCTRGGSSGSLAGTGAAISAVGSVTMLLINLSPSTEFTIAAGNATPALLPRAE